MRLTVFLAFSVIAGFPMAAAAQGGAASGTGAACHVQLPSPSQAGIVANGGKACVEQDTVTVTAEPAKAPPSASWQSAPPPGLGKSSDAGFFTGLGAFLATMGVDASVPAGNLEDILPVSP